MPTDGTPPTSLCTLPAEILTKIASHLTDAHALLALCAASHELNAAADTFEPVWKMLLTEHFQHALEYCWRGNGLPPGSSWRQRYVRFANMWMEDAHAAHGTVLLYIEGHVYDVSTFLGEHPGDEQLLLAAIGRDATEAFQYVGHSTYACRLLQTLAVPQLDRCADRALAFSRELPSAAAGSIVGSAATTWRSWALGLVRDALDGARASLTGDPGPSSMRRSKLMEVLFSDGPR